DSALPNFYGITVTRADGSTIGGAIDGARNVISGNKLTGVSIGFLTTRIPGGSGTTIQGNYIGTNAAGTGPLPNLADGVYVELQSQTHTVSGNLIAFNGGSGVRIPNISDNGVTGPPAFQINIDSNLIY